MYAISSAQMRALEQRCRSVGISERMLMENAGHAAAVSINGTIPVIDKNCVVFCGKGNNGGDGFVVALELKKLGGRVKVILADGVPKSRTAQEQYERAYSDGIEIIDLAVSPTRCELAMHGVDIVIDAIYGTGFRGGMTQICKKACVMINSAIAAVFSLDIPSGVEADSFESDPDCVNADFTVAFDSLKPAHIMPFTAMHCGNICVVEIGIPASFKSDLSYQYAIVDETMAHAALPVRALDSHKGDHGHLLIVAGSSSYSGAAALSSLGALRSGVGYVTLASIDSVCSTVATLSPEVVQLRLPQSEAGTISSTALDAVLQAADRATAVCIGCGLGRGEDVQKLVYGVLTGVKCPVILDADGINAVAENINILSDATAPLILTPHLGELSRLLKVDTADIQKNKYELVGNFAKRYNVTVLCKGYRSFVAPQAVGAYINTTGNSGLAKAGSGDLLSGIIGALAAQGLSPEMAAAVGAYYHGRAGDLCERDLGAMYMQPTDVASYLSKAYLNI